MIDLEERHYKLLCDILAKYPYTFYAYGSRTTGKARRFSDLDICYFGTIPPRQLYQLEEDLDESDLPFTIDLVSWEKSSERFKKAIFPNLQFLQGDKDIKNKVLFS